MTKLFAAEKDPNHYYLLMAAFYKIEPKEMLGSLKEVWTENKPAREFCATIWNALKRRCLAWFRNWKKSNSQKSPPSLPTSARS